MESAIQTINAQSTPVTQIRNGTSTSTNVIENNPGTEDVYSKEAQNMNRHLGDNQEPNKDLNKEETEIQAGTSSKADLNKHTNLENRTGTSRTSKSQRSCPKPKKPIFMELTNCNRFTRNSSVIVYRQNIRSVTNRSDELSINLQMNHTEPTSSASLNTI